ncbi:ankyrin repeat and MYND domain-containing protein 1 [Rhinophrynus dorsalis]
MNMKLGYGEFRWVNGESYTGEFYKDHHHGKGVYTWPDGSKFTGSFFLSRKEGYGTMFFNSNQKYQGLYKSDIRYGPGIESYQDGCQDVGIWLGHHLIRLCTKAPGSLSLSSYPEFCQQPYQASCENECHVSDSQEKEMEDPFLYRYKLLLLEDSYTLPEMIYCYSTDTDHLPLPPSVRTEFNLHFYRGTEESDQPTGLTIHKMACTNEMKGIQEHVHKHRRSPEYLVWDITSIMNADRAKFGLCGPRELVAEQFIRMAGEGNSEIMSRILRHDLAHVDVSDMHGFTALHAAAVAGHHDIINLLLDHGADVNKCTEEGLSALTMCLLLSYSAKSFRANIAERNFTPLEQISQNEQCSSDSNNYEVSCQKCTTYENEETDASTSPSNDKNKTNSDCESKESHSHCNPLRRETMNLLLLRGADPNMSSIPMHALFFAIKAADVDGVQFLLERGAGTDIRLTTKHGTITPLHLAVALPGVEGVRITELLLHAAADPDARAGDGDDIYKPDMGEIPASVVGFPMKGCLVESGLPLHHYYDRTTIVPEEGGRAPLHVVCEREDNYKFARDIVNLLVSHNANPNTLWSGHSPLSLAVASGNDLAVKELLAHGADPNLPLSRGVGSALCAAVNTAYEKKRTLPARIALVDRLIKAGASILMPITIGGGKKTALGTATDYAFYKYFQDKRIAHTPYHALSSEEREIFNARKQLLEHLGNLTREAVTTKEKEWAKEGITRNPGFFRDADTKISKCTAGEDVSAPRRAFFKFCYQCGRSIGVKLTPCLRCYSIYSCSKQCKKRSWDEFHKEECLQLSGKLSSKISAHKSKKTRQIAAESASPPTQQLLTGRGPGMQTSGESIPLPTENYSFN